jgi:hypothetical protein
MAQVVGRRPLTAEDLVVVRVSPCGICSGQSDSGTAFLRVLRFSPIFTGRIIWGMNERPFGGFNSDTVWSYRHEQRSDDYCVVLF